MEPMLNRVSEVKELLGISNATVYRMIERGELEMVKLGPSTRITRESIARLLKVDSLPTESEHLRIDPLRRAGKVQQQVAAQAGIAELEKRVAALEREVAAQTKLISKLRKALNECP